MATGIIAIPTSTAVEAIELSRVYKGQQFEFDYPSTFALAWERNNNVGDLVAVANYTKYLTFVVERQPAPPGAAGGFCARC